MEVYTVTVATGNAQYSGTNNYIFVTLVGEKGESERTLLDNPGLDFCRGAVSSHVTTLGAAGWWRSQVEFSTGKDLSVWRGSNSVWTPPGWSDGPGPATLSGAQKASCSGRGSTSYRLSLERQQCRQDQTMELWPKRIFLCLNSLKILNLLKNTSCCCR